jgi:uncharacterized protein YigE (DUF2233 family)
MRALLVAFLIPGAAQAACADMTFDGVDYTVCDVQAGDDLRLFSQGPDGNLGSFGAVNDLLSQTGEALTFAMNAGMYHPDRRPVGLYIEDGVQQTPLVTAAGPGNFGLLPNGVFCVRDGGFAVIETRTFAASPPACRYATQSGPMLVIEGALHPRFLPDSDSLYVRNGVGVSPDGQTAFFAISSDAVNFDHFARLFRDALNAPNALFLDGSISRLYAPNLDRDDIGFPMGPIIGTVTVAN